ncbi:MAG: hypothetical protein KatS3mg088_005 [Patescibacteria group bacterium]|nr:MAG: hypothetical protein KatS3mg088_005 [Patescibacteria group bacterium]
MKRLIVLFAILFAFLSRANGALAQETVCTTVYGGGVVCGAKAPEHKPVETGIEDYPLLVASALVGSAFILYRFSKKIAL